MDYEKIETLLNEVKPIVEENKKIRAEKERKGEFFNIFSILRMERDEVHTHSAMLSELLSPNGSHGQGGAFLKLFLKMVVHKEDLVADTAEVETEFSIGAVSEDGKSGGRIDIVVRFPNYLILIENKIDAGDQPSQLERYNNYALEKVGKGNYTLLYLTKNGHEPSEYSTGKSKKHYWDCISYASDIKEWLEECRKVSGCPNNVSETIGQYIKLIDKLTGQEVENKMNKQLTVLMQKHLDEVLEIFDNKESFDSETYSLFIQQMKEVAESLDCSFEDFDYVNLWYVKWESFSFSPKNSPDCKISIVNDGGVIYCFGFVNNKCKKKLECFDNENQYYPYGWNWFKYANWNSETIRAIYNGDMKKYVTKILKTVLDDPNFPK